MAGAVPLDALWLGAGAGLGLGGAWWGAQTLFHRALLRGLRAERVAHKPPIAGRSVAGARIEAVTIAGPGGYRLAAWFVQPERGDHAPAPAALAMHGWGVNASSLWPLAQPLVAAGMNLLLIDARCHGDSDDDTFTSLPRFAEDIGAGLDWLRGRDGVDARRLALVGHSVGAAAALLAAAREPAGAASVRAVVSLASFAHPEDVMRHWLRTRRLGWPPLADAVIRHVQSVIGARFDDIAPLRSIRKAGCPVLLVHGMDDETVPFDHALRLWHVRPDAELLPLDGGHDLREALMPQAQKIVAFLHSAFDNAGVPAASTQPPSATAS